MNENVMFIRVAAVDLSGMVEEMELLRYRLREMDKKLSTETQTWAQETGEVMRRLGDFRRAVQEALGYDQPELVDEATVVEDIRQVRRVLPWKTFSIDVVDPGARPDDVAGRPAYAKMIEREPATLADGTQARFFSDARRDEGPPTESMPPVEEPPAAPDGYAIGRVFVRDDTIPEDVLGLMTRLSDVWLASVQDNRQMQFWNDQADKWWRPQDLLHMHGTMWELLNATSEGDQDSGQVSGE